MGVAVLVHGKAKSLIGLLSWVKALIMLAQLIQQRHRIKLLAEEVYRGSVILLFCRTKLSAFTPATAGHNWNRLYILY